MPCPLILGSTSIYRRDLLLRLNMPFEVAKPDVDETPLPHESPAQLAMRLALAKARAVASQHPHACVIGSDQVLDLDGECVGKPLTHANATLQLQRMRGKSLVFHTAVAVVHAQRQHEEVRNVITRVQFRMLSDEAIERYLSHEQPYDCAGSAKSEGLGISLTQAIQSDDPTALIGLPLIAVCDMLRNTGFDLP
ncbi:MAG: hypothetical protein RLZZ397_819 [Pseudomonadota bacterium]